MFYPDFSITCCILHNYGEKKQTFVSPPQTVILFFPTPLVPWFFVSFIAKRAKMVNWTLLTVTKPFGMYLYICFIIIYYYYYSSSSSSSSSNTNGCCFFKATNATENCKNRNVSVCCLVKGVHNENIHILLSYYCSRCLNQPFDVFDFRS